MHEEEFRKMEQEESSNWWFSGRFSLITSLLKERKPVRVLEIGPGTGRLGKMLSAYSEYICVENDASQAGFLRKKGLKVVTGSVEELGLPSNSFDACLAFDVLEHVADDGRALRQMHRVLRPGGTLFLSVPLCKSIFSEHDVRLGHFRRYSAGELGAKLKEAGFEITEQFRWNFFLFLPIFLYRKLFNRRGAQEGGLSDVFTVPRVLNSALHLILLFENAVAPLGLFPFGLSYFAVARKKGSRAFKKHGKERLSR